MKVFIATRDEKTIHGLLGDKAHCVRDQGKDILFEEVSTPLCTCEILSIFELDKENQDEKYELKKMSINWNECSDLVKFGKYEGPYYEAGLQCQDPNCDEWFDNTDDPDQKLCSRCYYQETASKKELRGDAIANAEEWEK